MKFHYLGGKLRYDGSLVLHLKHRGGKGERALDVVMQIWKKFPYMTLHFQLELAEALVASVLRFGAELWAWSGISQVDRVDSQCLRKACGVSGRVADAVWVAG